MDEKIPLRDVLNSTANILEQISVPMSYMQQIANPISIAIKNLKACVEAIDFANAEKQQVVIEEVKADGNVDTE